MKLIIASNNKHKIYEIKKILGGKFDEIMSLKEAGIDHETVEDGTTFMENAIKKCEKEYGKFVITITGVALIRPGDGEETTNKEIDVQTDLEESWTINR